MTRDQPPGMPQTSGRLTQWDAIGLFLIVAAEILLAYHIGMRGVEQWDMSIFADGAYRIYQGQMPYRDFHIPMGPVTFYLVGMLCRLLGDFNWSNLILANALIGGTATIISFLSLRLNLPTRPSLVFAAVFATTFALPLSFPWHDVVAMLWATAVVWLYVVALKIRFATRTHYLLIGVAGSLTALSILSKHNIGGALFLMLSALLLCLPFQEGEKWGARFLRVTIYGLACFLVTTGAALYFQSHGAFMADVTVANNQLSRLTKLSSLLLLVDDFRFWWEPWRLDIKLLLMLAIGVPVVWFLRRISLWRLQMLGVAFVCLALTFFTRKTGVGAYQMYAMILPLALGFLYTAFQPVANPAGIPTRRLLLLWYPALALSVGLAAAAFFRQSDPLEGRLLIANRYSPSWLCLIVCLSLFAGWLMWVGLKLRKNSDGYLKAGTVHRSLAIFRAAILIVGVSVGAAYLHLSSARHTWHESYTENLTAFQNIPRMNGVQATPAVVRGVEDLEKWFRPRLEGNIDMASGTQVFIYPSFQMLYSVLQVQSFKGVSLWYDWNLSYSKEDCDTKTIRDAAPRFIVSHEFESNAYGVPQRAAVTNSPELSRYLASNYKVSYRNELFTVFEARRDLSSTNTAR